MPSNVPLVLKHVNVCVSQACQHSSASMHSCACESDCQLFYRCQQTLTSNDYIAQHWIEHPSESERVIVYRASWLRRR